MGERVCLVTGANSGLGKAVAEGLAARNARVVMVCRDRARGEAARSAVVSATGSDRVELQVADVSSLRSVRALADDVRRRHRRLDVLFGAAATLTRVPERTGDGMDRVLATNHLGHYLLVSLLLDLLRASAPARVLLLAGAVVPPADPAETGPDPWTPAAAFTAAQAANLLFVRELARRVDGAEVAALAVDPKLRSEGLTAAAPRALRWARGLVGKSPEAAAEVVLRLLAPETDVVSGTLYVGGRPVEAPAGARDPARLARAWAWSARQAGLAGRGTEPAPLAKALAPADA